MDGSELINRIHISAERPSWEEVSISRDGEITLKEIGGILIRCLIHRQGLCHFNCLLDERVLFGDEVVLGDIFFF